MHVIGIRSKTKLSEKVLKEAKNLLVIGCFCIGTNQVDLEFAATSGIAVFNSPFANSRSVAELVICEIITLARQLGDRSNEMHRGTWNKVSSRCWEIRGKTLGMHVIVRGAYPEKIAETNAAPRNCRLWPHRLSIVRPCGGHGHERHLL